MSGKPEHKEQGYPLAPVRSKRAIECSTIPEPVWLVWLLICTFARPDPALKRVGWLGDPILHLRAPGPGRQPSG